MGTWNVGPFENDTAEDWLDELRESDSQTDHIDSALELLLGDHDSFNSSVESVALAAAEIVAALIGYEKHDLPEHVLRTRNTLPDIPDPRLNVLKEKALRVTQQMRNDSESLHLWKDAGLDAEWDQSIQDLLERLNSPIRKVSSAPPTEAPRKEVREPGPGDVFAVPFDSDKRGFGQIISISPFYLEVVFEPLFGVDEPPPDDLTTLTELLIAVTPGDLISDGTLPIVDRTTPVSVPLPCHRTNRHASLHVENFSRDEAYPVPDGLSRHLRHRSHASESLLRAAFNAYHGDEEWKRHYDRKLAVEWREYAEKSRDVFEKAKAARLDSRES
jgi:hypothetical protein